MTPSYLKFDSPEYRNYVAELNGRYVPFLIEADTDLGYVKCYLFRPQSFSDARPGSRHFPELDEKKKPIEVIQWGDVAIRPIKSLARLEVPA